MKYFIDDHEISKEEFFKNLELAVDAEEENTFDELLNSCNSSYIVGKSEFKASEIIKKCDPAEYQCGLNEEKCYRLKYFQDEFESSEVIIINNKKFETKEENN